MLPRRAILTGIIAAPLIVRSGIIMPVRPLPTHPMQNLIPAYYDPRIQSTFWDELDSQFLGKPRFN